MTTKPVWEDCITPDRTPDHTVKHDFGPGEGDKMLIWYDSKYTYMEISGAAFNAGCFKCRGRIDPKDIVAGFIEELKAAGD